MHGFTVYECGRQVFVNMYQHAMRFHELGMQTKLNCSWDDEPPSFILEFMMNDVISLNQ